MEKRRLNKFYIFLFFFLVSCEQTDYQWYRKFENCEKQIDNKFPSVETPFLENYDSLCVQETADNITFPRVTPSYAVLHFDKLFKSDIRLTFEQMNDIVVILNDTANYRWGELGTPYFDRVITFHDDTGDCVGITYFDFGGQTYSYPSNAKMKWGGMKTDKLFELIKKIE